MKRYVLLKLVQQRLIEHYQAVGVPYSFYDAVRDLWEEGRYQSAPELPEASFRGWDGADLDEFERLIDQVPVDLDLFIPLFESGLSAQASPARMGSLDVSPFRIARYQATGLHTHDAFEVAYVAKGTAKLLCGGVRIMPTGSLCLISPHLSHDVTAGDDCLLLSVTLSEHTVETTLFRLLRQEGILSDFFRFGLQTARNGYMLFSNLDSREILMPFCGLFHEFWNRRDYFKEICSAYAELMFAFLLRQSGERHGWINVGVGKNSLLPMLDILKHIQANYKTTSLNETAAMFHYRPSYLSKQIKLNTGKNYSQLIDDLRMTDAKQLLQNTSLKIEEVAMASGFQSAVHFSHSFQKRYGMAPSTWRRNEGKK